MKVDPCVEARFAPSKRWGPAGKGKDEKVGTVLLSPLLSASSQQQLSADGQQHLIADSRHQVSANSQQQLLADGQQQLSALTAASTCQP